MKKILSEIYHETFTVKSRSDHMKEEYIQAVDRLKELEEQLCTVLPEEAVLLPSALLLKPLQMATKMPT